MTSKQKKDKIYRKETPQPEWTQIQLPARNATVKPKKTYGKKQRHSLPASFPPASTSKKGGKVKDKDPRQSTLTQIGWVPSTFPEDDDDELEPMTVDLTADDGSDDGKKVTTPKNARRTKIMAGSKSKRRSNIGGLELETDEEDIRARSKFYTQTLTQLPSWKQSGDENVDDVLGAMLDDELDTPVPRDQKTIHGATPPSKKRKRPSPSPPSKRTIPPPQTPGKQRMLPAEIPSSQPSPFTPNLAITERRYWSPLNPEAQGTDRTPLKNKSTNVGAPTPSGTGRPILKRKNSEIPDSWSTVNGGISSAPTTTSKRTPLKDITPWEDSADNVTAQERRPTQRALDEVIVDSDDDQLGLLEGEADGPGTPTPVRQAPIEGVDFNNTIPLAARLSMAPILPPQQQLSHPDIRPTPSLNSPVDGDVAEAETPSQVRRRPSSSSIVEKETPLSSPQKTSPAMPPISQLGYKSQRFESQRVPFEAIQKMAPQTDRSDVILSISPTHVKEIAEGTKTHEFRDYKMPQTVARIWIYTTQPACELKYMATIGDVKRPGELNADDMMGIGNQEFNEGKSTKFAYELKQVYQLNNPVSLSRMKENGWVEEAPVKYVYIPPAVLGELMGNLQRALFLEPGEQEEMPPPRLNVGMDDNVTISQELEEQLRSDIAHSTQLVRITSSPHPPQTIKKGQHHEVGIVITSSPDVDMPEEEEGEEEHVAETPARRTNRHAVTFAKPAVPLSARSSQQRLVEDSPLRRRAASPRQRQGMTEGKPTVPPSQATTASASSQPQRPTRLLRSRQRQGQEPLENDRVQDSQQHTPVPVSPPVPKPAAPKARSNKHHHNNNNNRSRSGSLPAPILDDDNDDEDEVQVIDDSPVGPIPRRVLNDDTQSILELGSLGSCSQGFGLATVGGGGGVYGEQDSLMDDSRIRKPPSDDGWDSDGEELE